MELDGTWSQTGTRGLVLDFAAAGRRLRRPEAAKLLRGPPPLRACASVRLCLCAPAAQSTKK